ncbi:glutamic acid-rich protein-like [Ananas comosus]|uniref:Glutamic acid-rich protein-like n=1 Tax=Ananas comosus TaxID=4615 RepID=A0A6P5GHD3_ANACO|nr:glutamic acid-rich protein-like [Ananas comosus]
MVKKEAAKERNPLMTDFDEVEGLGDEEDEDDTDEFKNLGKRGRSSGSVGSSKSVAKKRSQKGPLDVYFARDTEKVDKTRNALKSHEEEWARTGCSLMSNAWKDRRERPLINFLVNSPIGTVFLGSFDASNYVKNGEKMFELLDNMVDAIGEVNIVQVVTDNESANVVAVDGEKRPSMGYIYEAMDRAKEAIAKSFNEKEDKYNEVFKIIDKRALMRRYNLRDTIDPIVLNDVDDSNEWLTGVMDSDGEDDNEKGLDKLSSSRLSLSVDEEPDWVDFEDTEEEEDIGNEQSEEEEEDYNDANEEDEDGDEDDT